MNVVKESVTDTQAVLLLCGYFGKAGALKPLSAGEYNRLAKWLVEQKRRPADLLEMDKSELERVVEAKLEPVRIQALLRRGAALALVSEKWLRSGLWMTSRGDETYPKRLRKRLGTEAPPLLYGAGDPKLLLDGGLAIVGSRNASESSLEFTRMVASDCAQEGIAVVSGGARGIDSVAMQAAGEAGGHVIGVLAEGLLQAVRNRTNRVAIESGNLVLVSPFYPEAGFNAGNAMARNRYIYALADYALVVQSDLDKGGTWAGATENLREAWVPLFVRDVPQLAGNRELIRKGGRAFARVDVPNGLRAYLEGASERVVAAELFTAPSNGGMLTQQHVPPYEVNPPVVSSQTEILDRVALDLYEEFLKRLTVLLGRTAMSQKEIAEAFGLEAAQAKAWLRKALDTRAIEARGKPRKYAVAQRRLI